MQMATENADELIASLTLEYNKGRQQAITNELLDIMNEMPSEAEIVSILDHLGAPKMVEEIGLSEEILPLTFQATNDIRDKYVLSRLYWDLGLFE